MLLKHVSVNIFSQATHNTYFGAATRNPAEFGLDIHVLKPRSLFVRFSSSLQCKLLHLFKRGKEDSVGFLGSQKCLLFSILTCTLKCYKNSPTEAKWNPNVICMESSAILEKAIALPLRQHHYRLSVHATFSGKFLMCHS